MYITWLVKLILAHLVTDFILQPTSWIENRNKNHFRSPSLYAHGLVTAIAALLLIGIQYWWVVLIILVTHIAIDGWKSYRPNETKYFLIDQSLHLLVILSCWYFIFLDTNNLVAAWATVTTQNILVPVTAYVFVSFPTGILIGQLTKKWRDQITDAPSLGSAGKWIGIIERIVILTFVFTHQYEAIGFLIAAKSLLRFNETNRPEIKTEYLLIGTLISIAIAILTGLIALKVMGIPL